MSRKNTLGKIALGFAATSAAGIIALGSLGVQPQETEPSKTTIAQGSVAEYFSLKAEPEIIETEISYETIETAEPVTAATVIVEPVTVSLETTAPPETTANTTLVETTVPTQATTTVAPATYKSEQTVYWVSSGEVYHITSNCRTLKRSKTIYEGTIKESNKPRACKVCSSW